MNTIMRLTEYYIPWTDFNITPPEFYFGLCIFLSFLICGLLWFIQYIFFKKQKNGIKYEEILIKKSGNKKLNYHK